MMIFYPPPIAGTCTPVIVADMTDSSDQWSMAELTLATYRNMPTSTPYFFLFPPSVYSCKYNYEVQHNGSPLGQALKMTLNASIKTPPADLIAQVSVKYAESLLDAISPTGNPIANPQLDVMYAVVVERAGFISNVSRSFVAYSSQLQPDSFGTSATLFIRGAHFNDAMIQVVAGIGLQLNTILPLGAQLQAIVTPTGYILDSSAVADIAARPPVSGILMQPATFHQFLDKVCLQNKMLYAIDGQIIRLFSQTTKIPGADIFLKTEFSFLGSFGAVMWAVGVENYANVKFKTAIFNASLFTTITIYDDNTAGLFSELKSTAGLFSGLKRNPFPPRPASYDMIVLRYAIIRNDSELCCEVTATNNWLFSQCRVEGIFELKIYGGWAG